MDSTAIVVPATMLTRLYLIALYLPIACLGVSLLFPRLSSGAKVLLTGLLIGQISLILLNLEAEPASSLEKWLWWEDGEWNVFAAFSSLQMALVGVVAMATSGRDPERTAGRRLYFVGLSLVFLFIALDDFTGVFKSALDTPSEPWKQGYRILGAATAVLTVLMALRARQGARIWYLCLLLGLSLIGTGGLAIDNLSRYCGMLGIIRLDGCLTYETLEEGMEMLGTWLSLLAVLGLFSGPLSRPPFRFRRVPITVLVVLTGLLVSYSLQLPQELRRLALQYELANHSQTASVGYESSLSLLGFRTDRHKGTFAVGLYLSSAFDNIAGGQLGFSIHLVDQVTGDSVAGLDARAGGKRWIWIFDTENSSIFRQWMEIEQVPKASVNRALWIVLTVWSEDDGEFIRQRVLGSDLQLLDETQVVLGELVREAKSPPSSQVPLASYDNGFALAAVELPERAEAGDMLILQFDWRSDEDSLEDHAQFLHFVHEETGEWWGYDQQPLGPRLPTRLWYQGLADSETWQVPLPEDLAPGSYTVYTGLYRIYDSERLPVTDADAVPWPDNRVALGTMVIE